MKFNSEKCEVVDFWRLNQGRTYNANGRAQGGVVEQRYQGVPKQSSSTVVTQMDRV